MNIALVSIKRLMECVLIIIGLSFAVGIPSLTAQSLFLVVGAGYEHGTARLEFETTDTLRYRNIFEDGIDQVSGFAELSVPMHCVDNASIAARLTWSYSQVALKTRLPGVLVLIPFPGNTLGDEQYEQVEFSMQTIQLELLGRVQPFEGLQVSVGPVVGYRSVSDYRVTQKVDTALVAEFPPPYYVLDDGIIDDGSELRENHVAFGAVVIAGYELPLSTRLSVVPELRLRADLVSPFPDTKWHMLSAGGAISLKYSL